MRRRNLIVIFVSFGPRLVNLLLLNQQFREMSSTGLLMTEANHIFPPNLQWFSSELPDGLAFSLKKKKIIQVFRDSCLEYNVKMCLLECEYLFLAISSATDSSHLLEQYAEFPVSQTETHIWSNLPLIFAFHFPIDYLNSLVLIIAPKNKSMIIRDPSSRLGNLLNKLPRIDVSLRYRIANWILKWLFYP